MTFTLIDLITNTTTTIDLETLDDLTELADRMGWRELRVDMRNLTITVTP